jgi:hypothetical protein
MITEAAIFELMEKYSDTPEAGEAAYMLSQEMRAAQITENLSYRYGSGQGYAQVKEDFAEMTGYDVDDSNEFRVVLDDEERRLSRMTAPDVGAPLQDRIRHAFVEELVPKLQEQMVDHLSELSDEAQLIAGVARHGYDIGLWDRNVRNQTVWHCYALVNEHALTDREKSTYMNELIEAGCIYGENSNIRLTPMLARLNDPNEHLPFLKPVWPDTKH